MSKAAQFKDAVGDVPALADIVLKGGDGAEAQEWLLDGGCDEEDFALEIAMELAGEVTVCKEEDEKGNQVITYKWEDGSCVVLETVAHDQEPSTMKVVEAE